MAHDFKKFYKFNLKIIVKKTDIYGVRIALVELIANVKYFGS